MTARAWRLAPTLLALAAGIAFLILEPRPGDLAAHTFRAELFGREGFTIWNGQWYGGHHTPAYSVLSPPLAWLLGPRLLLVLAAVAAAALFERLARDHFGERASRAGALWFAAATGTLLATGRLPFALGVALGLAATLALARHRRGPALALAALCPLASPLAGLFLSMAATAYALSAVLPHGRANANRPTLADAAGDGEIRARFAVAAAALLPAVFLVAAFPEGGYAPFPFTAYLAIPAFCLAGLVVLSPKQRALRLGAVLYALGATLAVGVDTPVGGTAPRLGMLLGGPLLACAVSERGWVTKGRTAVLPLLAGAALLGYWQWTSAARDIAKAIEDPAARADYFEPLRQFMATLPDQRRIEIPFTSSRWEGAELAPDTALARGWLRQLDTGLNPVFYRGRLNRLTYASWLSENAVRYVALPSAKPDKSSYAERALIESGLPYLKPRWRSDEWRVYEVTLPAPFVIPVRRANVTLEQLGSDALLLRVIRPGDALVRVRFTPYWFAHGGCVERSGGWTKVTARRRGFLRLTTRFSPERVVSRGRRCDETLRRAGSGRSARSSDRSTAAATTPSSRA